MVKTIFSIVIALVLILGVSVFELWYVDNAFESFRAILCGLYEKAESSKATHEDGIAVQKFWEDKKKTLHVWLPHTTLEPVDFQLSEALGYLYEGQLTDALPKIEVLIDMAENIPHVFMFKIGNIF
jgi:hypothetical protein